MLIFCFTAALEIDEGYLLFQSIYRVTATDENSLIGDRLMVGGDHRMRCIYCFRIQDYASFFKSS